MKNIQGKHLVAAILAVTSAGLAYLGSPWWGWFLFAAAIIGTD